jgi:hypothetical protein
VTELHPLVLLESPIDRFSPFIVPVVGLTTEVLSRMAPSSQNGESWVIFFRTEITPFLLLFIT